MITIIDYKAGNLTSVQLAFEHIGQKVLITDKADIIAKAERVVFPGVGAASSAMDNLRNLEIIDAITEVVEKGVPFLGICIGMQLLFDHSEEDGGTDCMGLLGGEIKKFQPADKFCKVPQMGWNAVKIAREHQLFHSIEDQSEFYFVHSFYPSASENQNIIGKTDYADVTFCSAAGRDNIIATQFHPERSGAIGLRLLENFCKWSAKC